MHNNGKAQKVYKPYLLYRHLSYYTIELKKNHGVLKYKDDVSSHFISDFPVRADGFSDN